ncbi:hypothetical protein [Leptospira alexanderi]|uniref:hypothetical protein n=1 Tax=Leptospira alexanderi TaxID=100053 RepID=UPI000288D661|nr:hypothetical protein [Leptospira alexanderi]
MDDTSTTHRRNLLLWSLQALAQPADVQVRLFPDFVSKADELALDFDSAYRSARHVADIVPTNLQKDALDAIDAKLAGFSGESNAALWTESALAREPIWQEVRSLAKRALDAFNWSLGPPPFEPKDRGSTYVRG